MKYGYTLIYVEDVMGTLEFYEKALIEICSTMGEWNAKNRI